MIKRGERFRKMLAIVNKSFGLTSSANEIKNVNNNVYGDKDAIKN